MPKSSGNPLDRQTLLSVISQLGGNPREYSHLQDDDLWDAIRNLTGGSSILDKIGEPVRPKTGAASRRLPVVQEGRSRRKLPVVGLTDEALLAGLGQGPEVPDPLAARASPSVPYDFPEFQQVSPVKDGVTDAARRARIKKDFLGGKTDWISKRLAGEAGEAGVGGTLGRLSALLGPAFAAMMIGGEVKDFILKNREMNLMEDQSKNEMMAQAMLVQSDANQATRQASADEARDIRGENFMRDMLRQKTRQMDLDRLAAMQSAATQRMIPHGFEVDSYSPSAAARDDLLQLSQIGRGRNVLESLGIS